MPQAINIIFDGPPAAEAGRFVEVELDDGSSVNIGDWLERDGGTWALRIESLPGLNIAGFKLKPFRCPNCDHELHVLNIKRHPDTADVHEVGTVYDETAAGPQRHSL